VQRPRPSWIEWPLYGAAALIAVWSALPKGRVVGDGVDLSGTLWHFWWLAHCMATGQDPRTTDLMYHPVGKDLFAANGSNVIDALASVPFQWIWGPVDYQPVFVAAVLVLNALTFRVLARSVLQSRLAVVTATLAWELNPYVLFELADGRITQAVLPFVPLALWAFLRCLAPQGTRRDAVLAGAFTAAQAWIYWFMGYFLAAAFLWLVIHRLWRAPDRRQVLGRVGLAGGVCLALVALPAASMLQALQEPGPLNPVSPEGPRGRAHVVQTGLAGTLPFTGPGPWMLDLPAVTLGVGLWLVVGPGRARWGGLLATLSLVAVGPSLGLGPLLPEVPLPPYRIAMSVLPFFDRLWFPYRAMSVGMVPAALAAGFVVERVAARRVDLAVGLAAAWLVLLGLGLGQRSMLPLTHKALDIPETARWMASLSRGAVIHLPFGLNQRYLVWHLEAPLPLLGGMGESSTIQWPQGFWNRLESDQLRGLVLSARQPGLPVKWHPQHGQRLRAEGFRWVVFHKDRAALEVRGLVEPPGGWTQVALDVAMDMLVSQLSELLGPPVAVEGDLITWDLWRQAEPPAELAATPQRLAETSWTREEPPDHVKVLKLDDRDQFTRTPGFGQLEPEHTGPPKTLRRGTGRKPRGAAGPADQ